MNIASNKIKGIRASICWNIKSARLSREHNDLNVLCIPARLIWKWRAKRIVKVWLNTKFSNEKRHKRRLEKIRELGR